MLSAAYKENVEVMLPEAYIGYICNNNAASNLDKYGRYRTYIPVYTASRIQSLTTFTLRGVLLLRHFQGNILPAADVARFCNLV
jgi:hypothetical protein